jgi:hypothetical protein
MNASRYMSLSWRLSLYLAYSTANLKSFLKYWREYWYMGSMPERSEMTK